ncbi:DUF2799 domain-containing protein [Litorimonas sp. RW-G-Af-16]|uniref:DUF2799 domain-containing protein n=1 Tax=Litorimonas sp. RW-G-Af-16 TaxID=3241168 RepID=UPI003AAB1DF3
MTHYKHLILSAMAVPLAGLALSSCATISEDECIAGSWQDIGYNDGRAGNSRGRFADIASTCAKYDVIPNRNAYMSGYDSGLPLYCTFDNGISRGESGGTLIRNVLRLTRPLIWRVMQKAMRFIKLPLNIRV